MKWPSIKSVSKELTAEKFWLKKGEEVEVRLQVASAGDWAIHLGDPSFDQDHRGYWGASYLTIRTNCRELAKELLDQAKEHEATSR